MQKFPLLLFALLSVLMSSIRNVWSTNIPDRISISMGGSYSLTQLGVSPLSEMRRWYDRGLASPYLYIEYAQPLKHNELTIGIQIIEKGFNTSIKSPPSPTFEFEEAYQYRLSYIELPVQYRFTAHKYQFSCGAYASFLYDDTYRYNNTSVIKANPPSYNSFITAMQYPHPERFKSYDAGIRLGVSRMLLPSLFIDLSYQKGLVDADNRNSVDLRYNTSFLLGLKYKFLSSK
jgi:hypothetical protein